MIETFFNQAIHSTLITSNTQCPSCTVHAGDAMVRVAGPFQINIFAMLTYYMPIITIIFDRMTQVTKSIFPVKTHIYIAMCVLLFASNVQS